ncbi:hypothetical protein DB30_07132 [Enhygromyxa salina]|uniref:Lipoprotein n=1 Tax=Enhygromyxa salina TaxID=215803 RepID=A0A0C2CSI2_9BACT|nr:hypothetical protein [Enhygromyxa salina]KIG14136.1 hypothetical protein DB30_07132 [Enhygromyxa salina]
MRSLALPLLSLAALVTGCAGRPSANVQPVRADDATAGAPLIVEPGPRPSESTPNPDALDPAAAFFLVYEALREGDWAAFERFAGAPSLRFSREQSIGEVDIRVRTIPADKHRAWLAQAYDSWAPACAEAPDPPCMGLNPLALGMAEDTEPRCTDPGPDDVGVQCCSHDPMLLHNTPFLAKVCFDAEQRVTQISIIDG